MIAKEDGIFFSSQKNGVYASGYGNSVIEMKIPVEKLVLDDIFDTEAHLRIPLKNRNQVLDVSDYLVQSEKFSLSPDGEGGVQYGDYIVYGEEVTHASWEDLAPSTEDLAPYRGKESGTVAAIAGGYTEKRISACQLMGDML